MTDRRYSTSAWQKTRRAILIRDGHTCRVRGPRCTGVATTVHHLIPSSQAPHLFFASGNLVAACKPCNYGDGARVAANNSRWRAEQLQQVIEEQAQTIADLLERIAQYENAPTTEPRRSRPTPAIY